ncbi:MAG: hypothetical protein LBN98_01610, partial [Prevotellaceae bacterium]|nr:hypothetical protein [Prevotellaceae bacterium]
LQGILHCTLLMSCNAAGAFLFPMPLRKPAFPNTLALLEKAEHTKVAGGFHIFNLSIFLPLCLYLYMAGFLFLTSGVMKK